MSYTVTTSRRTRKQRTNWKRLPGSSPLGQEPSDQPRTRRQTAAAKASPAASPPPPPKQEPAAGTQSASSARQGASQTAKNVPVTPQGLTYKELKASAKAVRAGGRDHEAQGLENVTASLKRFKDSPKMRDSALALYVSARAFPRLLEEFGRFLLSSVNGELDAEFGRLSRARRLQLLFHLFAEYAVDRHSKELQAYREQVKTMDLRKPYMWYPVARSLQRRFIYHAGPTNSGKTYTALQAMREAASGLYCGPLRLLAMEVYDELNAAGTFCNLVTGQERRLLPGAHHTSCTIEMLNTQKRVDVAVIDEVQLLGDENRGWAWTRALQGCPANEIHVCGDGSAIRLVESLAGVMGEPLEIRRYERFSPLEVDEEGLADGVRGVQPGDCVVAFSRKAIYEVKNLIESATGLRTCVVYGALPPETRRQQARLFNEPDNEFSVMVASDAVGMGLNLNIRRIVFTTLAKFEGVTHKPISVSEIKQIAGRAGRRNSEWPVGHVTCTDPADMPALSEALQVPLSALTTQAAGLFPEFEHLEAYASKSLTGDFVTILRDFAAEARLDGTYFFCRQEGLEHAARLLDKVGGLSLQERYWFCLAPANVREPRQAAALLHFAARFAARLPVSLELWRPQKQPETPDELYQMEQMHQARFATYMAQGLDVIVSVWLWLSNRFEAELFPDRDAAEALSAELIAQMHDSLQQMYAHGDSQPSSRAQSALTRRIRALKQPFVKNLTWDARQHLETASEMQAKALLRRAPQPAGPTRQHGRKPEALLEPAGLGRQRAPRLAEAAA